jgi:hypothetical protein
VVIEPTVELEDEIAARIGELLQRRGLGELAVHPQREAVDAMLFQGSGENKSAQFSADTDVSRAEEERAARTQHTSVQAANHDRATRRRSAFAR